MIIKINRIQQNDNCTIGNLFIDDVPICDTLELPDRDNQSNISRIHAGKYVCKITHSPSKGRTFQITNVYCRSSILFHIGNWRKDTKGCILIGRFNQNLPNRIDKSRIHFDKFMNALEDQQSVFLEINECF